MTRPDDAGDVVAQPLGERRGGAAGRDGDRDGPLPVDGREDEAAEFGDVDDVAEQPTRLGVADSGLEASGFRL